MKEMQQLKRLKCKAGKMEITTVSKNAGCARQSRSRVLMGKANAPAEPWARDFMKGEV